MSKSTMKRPAPPKKTKPFQVIVVSLMILALTGSGLVSVIGML